jgi:hypothetical protein
VTYLWPERNGRAGYIPDKLTLATVYRRVYGHVRNRIERLSIAEDPDRLVIDPTEAAGWLDAELAGDPEILTTRPTTSRQDIAPPRAEPPARVRNRGGRRQTPQNTPHTRDICCLRAARSKSMSTSADSTPGGLSLASFSRLASRVPMTSLKDRATRLKCSVSLSVSLPIVASP